MVALVVLAALFGSCILPPATEVMEIRNHGPNPRIQTQLIRKGDGSIPLKPETDCIFVPKKKIL